MIDSFLRSFIRTVFHSYIHKNENHSLRTGSFTGYLVGDCVSVVVSLVAVVVSLLVVVVPLVVVLVPPVAVVVLLIAVVV